MLDLSNAPSEIDEGFLDNQSQAPAMEPTGSAGPMLDHFLLWKIISGTEPDIDQKAVVSNRPRTASSEVWKAIKANSARPKNYSGWTERQRSPRPTFEEVKMALSKLSTKADSKNREKQELAWLATQKRVYRSMDSSFGISTDSAR